MCPRGLRSRKVASLNQRASTLAPGAAVVPLPSSEETTVQWLEATRRDSPGTFNPPVSTSPVSAFTRRRKRMRVTGTRERNHE
jgi:hypothetical protein